MNKKVLKQETLKNLASEKKNLYTPCELIDREGVIKKAIRMEHQINHK